jgi:hypothetical protein
MLRRDAGIREQGGSFSAALTSGEQRELRPLSSVEKMGGT